MSSRAESQTIYAAGLVQGIALVTFPAASTILTAPGSYALSSSQYGSMFIPQVITAVTTSLLGAGLGRRFGAKRVYLAGLAGDLAAMVLLIVSHSVATDHAIAYPLLLAATACLGAGFGLTVPSINTFTAAFHPAAVDRSVLVLNALLGLGTALAPVFVTVFVSLGFWLGLPALAASLLVILFVVSLRLPLRAESAASPGAGQAVKPSTPQETRPTQAAAQLAQTPHPAHSDQMPHPDQEPHPDQVPHPTQAPHPEQVPHPDQVAHPAQASGPGVATRRTRAPVPGQFWVFAGFAVLYGFCETMNGNWSQLDLESLKASATQASLALTVFWAMTTAGRVLFAVIARWFPSRLAYHLLPFLLAGVFVLIAALPSGHPGLGILAFALAGLGCSALLPLTISFGQEKLTAVSGGVAGGVIAFYQLGYGIAAFGMGPLRSAGITLPAVFGISAAVAAAMGLLSFAVAHHRPSPASLHPRPAWSPALQPRE
jgi:MFS family permease